MEGRDSGNRINPSSRATPGGPRWAISVDLKAAKMVAPYKGGEYYRSVYFSKASAVEEDHSKSSDDKTRISREPDVEGEPTNAKGHDVASAVSLVNKLKQKGGSRRDTNHEKDMSRPKK